MQAAFRAGWAGLSTWDAARLQVIEADFRRWEGSVEEKSKEVIHLQQELEEEVQELSRLLKDSTYPDLAAVREVLAGKLDLPGVRERLTVTGSRFTPCRFGKRSWRCCLPGCLITRKEHVALCQRVEAALVREQEMLAEQGALGARSRIWKPVSRAGEDRAGVGRFGVSVDEFADVEGIVPGK